MSATSNRHQVSIEADPKLPIIRMTRDFDATPALRLSTSADGITWTQHPTPVLRAGVTPEFNNIVYRSTLEYDARTDMVTLWYSGARASGESWMWSAAVERRLRGDLFRLIDTPEPARRSAVLRSTLQLTDAP